MGVREDEELGETYAERTPEQHQSDIADELRDDINTFADAVSDPCEAPGFLKALHDLVYGRDPLDAALTLRRDVRFMLGEFETDEVERRVRGKPLSSISRRLKQTIELSPALAIGKITRPMMHRFAAERLASDMRSGKALGIPQGDRDPGDEQPGSAP